jgi:arsenate reductase
MPKRVLILCTGNSCRSQMAEYIWNRLADGEWRARSAGSQPAGYVHPLAIQVMQELEEDLSAAESKNVDQFVDQRIDLVVTVCDAAKESCPTLNGAKESIHWPFEDPAGAVGTDEQKIVVFRDVRNQIRARIDRYLRTGI